MDILIYLNLLFLVLFLLVLLPLGILFFIDTFKGHDLPTSKKAIKKICEIISKHQTKSNNFYDLGCGRGTLALAIKKAFPQFHVYALDKSHLRLFFAKIKTCLLKQKIHFQKTNLFKKDLRNADIIYTYLWYDLMPPLEKKLKKELKKGALIITNTSCFPNWQPTTTYIIHPKNPDFEKLFVHVKK